MAQNTPIIQSIESQKSRMVSLVTEWSNQNSGSRNIDGLAILAHKLRQSFDVLGGSGTEIHLPVQVVVDRLGQDVEMPLGKAISIRKRPEAPVQVFLGIHYDTVYGTGHVLQTVRAVDERTLNGPGVADAKGGLCVMLVALEAFERSAGADRLGWEILINPDEELGSPGSASLLVECAKRNQIGMVFEPALADGTMVGERKGSGNFAVVIRGKAAHAGRDFHQGRSAIHAAAELIVELEQINRIMPGTTVNVGCVDGGGPTNVVADLAVVRFNARVPAHQPHERVEAEIKRSVEHVARRDGITLTLTGSFSSPARPMDLKTASLYRQMAECGRERGMTLTWHASGGVSDANKLAAAGLPVVDTLGPCGGNLHSAEEFVLIDTLVPKAQLTALMLMKLADGSAVSNAAD